LIHIVNASPASAGVTDPFVTIKTKAVATFIIDEAKSSRTPTHLILHSNRNVAVVVASISFIELKK
jgi:hypothetical protein